MDMQVMATYYCNQCVSILKFIFENCFTVPFIILFIEVERIFLILQVLTLVVRDQRFQHKDDKNRGIPGDQREIYMYNGGGATNTNNFDTF